MINDFFLSYLLIPIDFDVVTYRSSSNFHQNGSNCYAWIQMCAGNMTE